MIKNTWFSNISKHNSTLLIVDCFWAIAGITSSDSITLYYSHVKSATKNRVHIIPLDMKGCLCHFTVWQRHPFISKGPIWQRHPFISKGPICCCIFIRYCRRARTSMVVISPLTFGSTNLSIFILSPWQTAHKCPVIIVTCSLKLFVYSGVSAQQRCEWNSSICALWCWLNEHKCDGSEIKTLTSGQKNVMITHVNHFPIFLLPALWQWLAYLCTSPDNPALALYVTRWTYHICINLCNLYPKQSSSLLPPWRFLQKLNCICPQKM